MIKRTIYFGNPAYLHLQNAQLIVKLPEVVNNPTLSEGFKKTATASIPIEDIGVIVLDHSQITISQSVFTALIENNVAIINCNDRHLPIGLTMPLAMNTLQSERFRQQIDATEPLKKNIWQQITAQKIRNQSHILNIQNIDHKNMLHWADKVTSGDTLNHEARAAAYYWARIFNTNLQNNIYQNVETDEPEPNLPFLRGREEAAPNNLLNYGYAILRAIVARGLVASGLLPTLGVHHRNKYNAYCLADDVMEPYRPVVDKLVLDWLIARKPIHELSKDTKAHLLSIPTLDVIMDGERSPLMIAVSRTTASLAQCYAGERRKVILPEMMG